MHRRIDTCFVDLCAYLLLYKYAFGKHNETQQVKHKHLPQQLHHKGLTCLELLIPTAKNEYNICEKLWKAAKNYSSYMKLVTCVRLALGSKRFWPGKIRIYNRAHGFVRDGWNTDQIWSPADFMFHGWKANELQKYHPFSKVIDPEKCGVGLRGWHWNSTKRRTADEVKKHLGRAEKFYRSIYPEMAKIIPFLDLSNISSCYPHCETV
ncbi:hypothetical protein COOONC_20937 [Cooperia oncophora]